ncbi:MAG: hypothetical protein ACFFG0_04635 [Candidatus Thorarchaeota archaeon]
MEKSKLRKKIFCTGIRPSEDPFFGTPCDKLLGVLTDRGLEIKCNRCRETNIIKIPRPMSPNIIKKEE